LPRHIFDEIDVAGLQGGDAQVLVRVGHRADGLELGKTGLVVFG